MFTLKKGNLRVQRAAHIVVNVSSIIAASDLNLFKQCLAACYQAGKI